MRATASAGRNPWPTRARPPWPRERARLLPDQVSPPEGTFAGELMPFQQEGLAFLLRSRRALLADEMGLGKTVQALAFLAATAALPALIIAPPHLIRNWQREAERFLTLEGGVRVHVIKGLTPYPLPPADLYIMPLPAAARLEGDPARVRLSHRDL